MSQPKTPRPRRVRKPKARAAGDATRHPAASTGELTDEQYYGLTAKPFSLSIATPAPHRNQAHMLAYESLLGALQRRQGLIVLTGEAGTGKTTVCRVALDGLDRRALTAVVPDPSLSREDLLRTLLVEFGEVSVDEMTSRRLSGASRVELWHQLRRFLASLEADDPYVVLVIDEAQRLSGPLLDEVHALSELEVGGVPLQIVFVGQPDLQSHLETPEMLQLNQRVTTRCQLRSLTTEEVGGYVEHRLAMVGGAPARISFAPEAIEMIHAASSGVPRLVNVICGKAMASGRLERTAVIGQSIVAAALADLQLAPAAQSAQALEEAATVSKSPPGLFERRLDDDSGDSDIDAMLALPKISPLFDEGRQAERAERWAFSSPARRGNGVWHAGRWNGRGVLRALSLVVMGMVVVSISGGFVVTAERAEPLTSTAAFINETEDTALEAPIPGSIAGEFVLAAEGAEPLISAAAFIDETEDARREASIPESIATESPSVSQDTWVVQVAALKNSERARAIVAQLSESGLPAFATESETRSHGLLNFVRVGPFTSRVDAADIGKGLREHIDFHDAFVAHVTTR